ncbi:hypothetical protein DYD21_08590 [Rhodohalobacter sp. SW132]|nr:hypothetical protein DYD21_08590 [Rhodohalobacter sp. SW132]
MTQGTFDLIEFDIKYRLKSVELRFGIESSSDEFASSDESFEQGAWFIETCSRDPDLNPLIR